MNGALLARLASCGLACALACAGSSHFVARPPPSVSSRVCPGVRSRTRIILVLVQLTALLGGLYDYEYSILVYNSYTVYTVHRRRA